MTKIQIKTFSLRYDAQEDRMQLILNKGSDHIVEFWITRRFYLSVLFDLETFLELHQLTSHNSEGMNPRIAKEYSKNTLPVKKKIDSSLLKSVNLKFVKEKEVLILILRSEIIEANTIFNKDQLIDFYTMLKKGLPKTQWGFI